MPEWLTNLFSLSREISSKIALPIFATAFLILFLPSEYAATLGIDQFRDAFRIWIGVLLVLSAAALASNFLWMLGDFIRPFAQEKFFIFLNKGALHSLTNDEKAIVRRFVVDGEASVRANMADGTINLLERKMVVIRASSVSAHNMMFDYIMQPWAREYLRKRKHLLD